MVRVVVAHSNDPDTVAASDDLLQQAEQSLAGDQPIAAILLAAIDFDHARLIGDIRQRWPDIPLVGCTTDGEMSSVAGFQQDSVALTLFCGDDISVYTGVGRGTSEDSESVGADAVKQALAGADEDIRLCFTFPEALDANGVNVVKGIQAELGANVPVVGGLAADQWRFVKTYQFCNDEVLSDSVPVMLFAGNLIVSHGVASGWRPVGRRGKVTRSSGSDLLEIDGIPALEFYRGYLGEKTPSSQYPLAVFLDSGNYYLRAPSGHFDEATGAVNFFADVPEGAEVQMTEATRDSIVAATRDSMSAAINGFPGAEPAAAVFVSCASRRQLLGTRTGTELESAISRVDAKLPHVGFYANGEIGPYRNGGETYFHNETFVTLLLGSEAS